MKLQLYNHYFLATHSGRIKCLLKKYFNINDKMSFGNCAIIKLYKKNTNLYAELIYEGEKTKNYNKKNKFFTFTTFPPIESKIDLNYPLNNDIIYLIRHGEGVHNTKSLFQKVFTLLSFDPLLTSEGIKQAENCGVFLKEYINKNINVKDKIKFYSSYMNRAYTTIAHIMNKCDIHHNKKIIIIPCSHEIPYKSNSKCDEKKIYIYPENTPKCFNSSDICLKVLNYNLSWKYFMDNNKRIINKFNCSHIDLFYFFLLERRAPN